MKPIVDLSGLDRLIGKMKRIENPDPTPLLVTWMKVIDDDNRKGVLAGLDKDGKRMPGVTYRPVGKAARANARQKNNAKGRRGKFSGFGPAAAGLHNNLSGSEYRKLGGPPLAPRGAFSRVVTNLRTGYGREGPNQWVAYGLWFDVVSRSGTPFLGAHFTGAKVGRGKGFKLPIRDLRGVRPEGRIKARRAAVAWMSDMIRYFSPNARRGAA